VARSAFAMLVGLAILLPRTAEATMQAEASPSVSVSLPPNVPSDTVQISYFLIGPFGGYSGYTPQRAGLGSYEIPTGVEGQAATEVRMIIFAPGCEIQKLVIPLAGASSVSQEFLCQRVKTVELSGQIVANQLVRNDNTELVVTYMAYWAHGFYGLADGFVTQVHLASIPLGTNGTFRLDLPYFSEDSGASSSQQRASFRLTLHSKTWDHITLLEPDISEFKTEDHSLRIQPHYPDGLRFRVFGFEFG
jgi:hypothetical protein